MTKEKRLCYHSEISKKENDKFEKAKKYYKITARSQFLRMLVNEALEARGFK